jgi:NADH dehydrogenase
MPHDRHLAPAAEQDKQTVTLNPRYAATAGLSPVAKFEPPAELMRSVARRPRVVIIGAGFAGLSAAKALAGAPVDITVIDRHNYHLFQPLLYQVATAGLSPADVATPIRSILSRQRNATVLMARVNGIDIEARQVEAEYGRVPYDMLIVATGARHAYFGRDDWEQVAPGLKKIEDATDIRRKILLAFERAETIRDPAEDRRLLNFVIIGGGPTGVELAGAIADLGHKALASEFRNIDPRETRVILVEAGSRLLANFPKHLSANAMCMLEELGVEVRVGQRVTGCDEGGRRHAHRGAHDPLSRRCCGFAGREVAQG